MVTWSLSHQPSMRDRRQIPQKNFCDNRSLPNSLEGFCRQSGCKIAARSPFSTLWRCCRRQGLHSLICSGKLYFGEQPHQNAAAVGCASDDPRLMMLMMRLMKLKRLMTCDHPRRSAEKLSGPTRYTPKLVGTRFFCL